MLEGSSAFRLQTASGSRRKARSATPHGWFSDHQVRLRACLTLFKRGPYYESETARIGRWEFIGAIAHGGERERLFRSVDRIMPVSVGYDDERLEFAIPAERVVVSWNGPSGPDGEHELAAIREAIEQPCDFPPLRQLIVPGDRVAIALDARIARPQPILEEIGRVLREAGVEPEGLTVLTPSTVRRQACSRKDRSPGRRWRFTILEIAASSRIWRRLNKGVEFI